MTPDEQNRFVHEKIMGLCWHEGDVGNSDLNKKCRKCKEFYRDVLDNPDYTQPEHYWKVLEKLLTTTKGHHAIIELTYDELLHPPRGLAAICEFFKEK